MYRLNREETQNGFSIQLWHSELSLASQEVDHRIESHEDRKIANFSIKYF